MKRRHFLSATIASSAVAAVAAPPTGIIDCQSHLFFPKVLDMMRKRKTEPLVYDDKGTVFLKMGDWLRKVPPHYLDVNAKLAAMDASGIGITMLSTNDPGPEWFGTDGPAVAQLIHDSIAGVIAQHPTRFSRAVYAAAADEQKILAGNAWQLFGLV
jgi:predicted TIM-barrel fold metal-dependent hydrolase